MSFGLSATALGWIAAGTATAAVVGSTVASADAQRKAAHTTQDAINQAQADDARNKVEAETNAVTAANAKLAAGKRAQQANVLSLGGNATPGLGGTGSVLGAGAPTVSAGRAVPQPQPMTGAF